MEPQELERIKAVFFDLDGTLVQVSMRDFIPSYVRSLSSHFADLADRRIFRDTFLAATHALLASDDGDTTNEELFLASVERHLGIGAALFKERLGLFCEDGLADLAPLVRALPLARTILARCFDRGLTVVIATNPVFPRPVVEARLLWGKIHDYPYHLVTTYENTRYCKPHPNYFRDLLDHLGLGPDQCLMVGNDTEHDLAARQVGIPTFLVDTWLVDRHGAPFETDFRGGHMDLCRLAGRLGQAD